MPPGYEHIYEYDGRASLSSSAETRVRYGSQVYSFPNSTPNRTRRSPSIKSESPEDSTELSYKDFIKRHLDIPIQQYLGFEDGEIKTTDVTATDSTDFNHIQHLSGLRYGRHQPDGRRARRQSSRDPSPSRSRSPKRQYTRQDSVSTVNSSTNASVFSETSHRTTCICPISYQCPARETDKLLDCRTLVVEWKKWQERGNQEAYNIYDAMPIEDAPYAQEDMVTELVRTINHFRVLSPNSRISTSIDVEKIWKWTHELHKSNITEEVLVNTQILNALRNFLHNNNAQMRADRRFPIRLEEDLKILFRKWERGDLICDPNRGLIRNTVYDQNHIQERVVYLLDPNWQHYISADFYGEGHLVNGQVFYSRTQLMRDGAHSARIAGISGSVEKGARSIVMGYHDTYNNDYYADIDMGNTIDYIGTALKSNKNTQDKGPTNIPDGGMETRVFDSDKPPTACTRMMMTSFRTGNPVRVIRSPGLAKQVKNRPHKCYRYDGLYKVVKMRPLKLERQIWSFRLTRIHGQGPLRGFDGEDPQPSSHGKRYGYSRYNVVKYGGGRRASSQVW